MERGKRKMSPKEIETGRRGKKRRRKKKEGKDGNKKKILKKIKSLLLTLLGMGSVGLTSAVALPRLI